MAITPLLSELSPIREWQKSSATIQRPAIWTGLRLCDSRVQGADVGSAAYVRRAVPAARGDIYVLSKMLGHSSVQVTQRHYAFIAPDGVGAKVLAHGAAQRRSSREI